MVTKEERMVELMLRTQAKIKSEERAARREIAQEPRIKVLEEMDINEFPWLSDFEHFKNVVPKVLKIDYRTKNRRERGVGTFLPVKELTFGHIDLPGGVEVKWDTNDWRPVIEISGMFLPMRFDILYDSKTKLTYVQALSTKFFRMLLKMVLYYTEEKMEEMYSEYVDYIVESFGSTSQKGGIHVVGYEEIASEVWTLLSYMNDDVMNRHVLLCGPPGCGKSMIVRKVMDDITEEHEDAIVIYLDRSDNWMEKAKALSEIAQLVNRVIYIVIDEIDELGLSRNVKNAQVYELLRFLDGTNSVRNIKIVATTNRAWDLDAALLRTGRFGPVIYVPEPTKEQVGVIYKYYMDMYGGKMNGANIPTQHVTGSDIRCAVEESVMFGEELNDENVGKRVKKIVEAKRKSTDKGMYQ